MQLELRGAQGERLASASGGPRFRLDRTLARDIAGAGLPARRRRAARAAARRPLEDSGLTVDGEPAQGGLTLVYYRAGEERLIAMLPTVAQRIGRIRGRLGGAWRAIAVIVLLIASAGLAAWTMAGLVRRRPRRVALLVATVAALNALAWGLLVPAIQIPDENYHLSYVQDLAEHGSPGRPGRLALGGAQRDRRRLGPRRHQLQPRRPRPLERRRGAKLDRQLAEEPSTDNEGASVNLRDYPPAYYATLVPVYAATHAAGGSTLDAMTFMRASASLFAGVTVLALLAFLLELFPGRPLLTGSVALLCAFQPVFTWISAGVNPDAMLIALGAVLFWLFARAFRRGLSWQLAAGLGATLAVAGLTKVAALGFLPGIASGSRCWCGSARARSGCARRSRRRSPPGCRWRRTRSSTASCGTAG